jgi:hypothetical protein
VKGFEGCLDPGTAVVVVVAAAAAAAAAEMDKTTGDAAAKKLDEAVYVVLVASGEGKDGLDFVKLMVSNNNHLPLNVVAFLLVVVVDDDDD